MRPRIYLVVGLLLATPLVSRADLFDRVNDALSLRRPEAQFQLQLSGLVDLELYYIDQRPPALIDAGDGFLFNPRVSLFLDVQWTRHFYFFSQVRIDRHFDPSDHGAQIRIDEYLLRYTPFDDARLNLQIGKFATVIGNWVPRHLSWDNPFINAPLPYENLTGIWDADTPADIDELLYWGHVGAYDTGFYDDKYLRLPVIWGPSYASGAAVTGSLGRFDYAAEIKNAALGSRPEDWDLTQRSLENPTFSGRVGFRPNEMWNLGFSASGGPYLLPEAAYSLPPDRSVGDYRELLLGQDVSFAWHHLQIWAEFFETRFEVPRLGNADVFSYYLETKYKFTTQFFGALRWNQQLYADMRDENEGRVRWGNDVWRVDAALGYRFTNFMQAKVQYSFTHSDSNVQFGEQLVAAQLTLKF